MNRKKNILVSLLIALLLFTTACNQLVRITIVVPPKLVPYYEWLIQFPGWQPPTPPPARPAPIEVHGYQSVTIRYQLVAVPTSTHNIRGLSL